MKKAFFFDVETTGLSAYKNDIIQIAAIIEINGEVKEEYETRVKPFDMNNIHPKALETNRVTRAQLETFPDPKDIYDELQELLGKYVNKYDKEDKFTPIGYNVKFDCDFLNNFFRKCGDNFYGSWFNWKHVDPLSLVYLLDYKRRIALSNYRLETVCRHFGIPIKSHDALSDIRATRDLLNLLTTKMISQI